MSQTRDGLIVVDRVAGKLRVYSMVDEAETLEVEVALPAVTDGWYRLVAAVTKPGSYSVAVTVTAVGGSSASLTWSPAGLSVDNGLFGLGSLKSRASFAYFLVFPPTP